MLFSVCGVLGYKRVILNPTSEDETPAHTYEGPPFAAKYRVLTAGTRTYGRWVG